MLDIGWTEMAIIAFVALIVIGPKDLPTAMRGVAKWVRKARSLSREFQSGLDEMMRETELDEAKKSIESVRRYRVDELVEKEVDPTGTVKRDLKAIDDEASDRRTATPAPASAPAGGAAGVPAGNGAAAPAASTQTASTQTASTTSGSSAAEASATESGGAPARKGKLVTHPAQVAPGNSVKPPAAAEATAKPAPAAAAKPAAKSKTSAKPAAKAAPAKTAATTSAKATPAKKPAAKAAPAKKPSAAKAGAKAASAKKAASTGGSTGPASGAGE